MKISPSLMNEVSKQLSFEGRNALPKLMEIAKQTGKPVKKYIEENPNFLKGLVPENLCKSIEEELTKFIAKFF